MKRSALTRVHARTRAGDEVLDTGPLACVVHDKYIERICHHCFQPLRPHRSPLLAGETAATRKPVACAAGCGGVVYCSQACAKAGEEQHAGECQVLQAWQAQSAAMQKATRGLRMFIRARRPVAAARVRACWRARLL